MTLAVAEALTPNKPDPADNQGSIYLGCPADNQKQNPNAVYLVFSIDVFVFFILVLGEL